MKTLIAVIVAASFMLVGGCSDPHANMHCVLSHDVVHSHPIYSVRTTRIRTRTGWKTSSTRYVSGYTHSFYNVCDRWVHN